MDMLFCF